MPCILICYSWICRRPYEPLLWATVDRSGLVTGRCPGSATVYCRAGGVEVTCRVTVVMPTAGAMISGAPGEGGDPLLELPYMLMYLTQVMPLVLFQYTLVSVVSSYFFIGCDLSFFNNWI